MVRHFLRASAAFCVCCSFAVMADEGQEPKDAVASVDATSTRPVDDLAVEHALDDVVSEFQGTTFQDLMKLAQQHKIDAVLDIKALEEAAISSDTERGALRAANVSLRALAEAFLEVFDLATIVRDGKLIITTKDKADAALVTRIYPVRDLQSRDPQDEQKPANCQALIDVLRTTVELQTWDKVGGPGSMAEFKNTLTISQTQRMQRRIEQVLTALRQSRADRNAVVAELIWARPVRDLAIYRQLEQKATLLGDFKFVETPLDDAVKQLAKFYDLPMQIDIKALEEAAVGIDTPVTHELRQVAPRVALDLLLRDFDLTYVISHEALLITTKDRADATLVTAVYPLGDLVDASGDYNTLIDVITTTVRPTTWHKVGGPGTFCQFAPTKSLVISQTEPVHEEVNRLLNGLRKVRSAQAKN